MQLTK